MVDNGYEVVGRYLTGNVLTSDGELKSKAMTEEELSIISDYALHGFPIYQDGGYESEYFVRGKGTSDAYKAIRTAEKLGFPSGTTIYFAVDFDTFDYEVDDKIIPYMREISSIFKLADPSYKVGVYGSRNTCIKCANDSSVKADHSFVSNMSTGFSGNLGFPMPHNWSFSQFYELSVGTGNGAIGIDKNDISGLDTGTMDIQPQDPEDTSEEKKVLLKEWRKMGPLFPILNMKPELFTTNISFDYTYEVYKSSLIDVDLIALTDFTIPGEDDDTIVVEVKNGDLGVTLKQLLGDSYFKLSKSQVKSYKELTEDIAASIDTGWLSLSTEFSTDNIVVSATAYKEEIPVGDNTVNLAITLKFTLKFNPFSEEYEDILEVAIAGIVIGVIVFMAPELLLGSALITAALIISFLTGNDEDEEA